MLYVVHCSYTDCFLGVVVTGLGLGLVLVLAWWL